MANRKGTWLSDENVMKRCMSEFPCPQSLGYGTMFQNKHRKRIAQAPTKPIRAMRNLGIISKSKLGVDELNKAYEFSMVNTPYESTNVTFWSKPAQIMMDRPTFGVAVSRPTRMAVGATSGGSSSLAATTTLTHQGMFPPNIVTTPSSSSGLTVQTPISPFRSLFRSRGQSTQTGNPRGRPTLQAQLARQPVTQPTIYEQMQSLSQGTPEQQAARAQLVASGAVGQLAQPRPVSPARAAALRVSRFFGGRPSGLGGAVQQAPDTLVAQGAISVPSATSAGGAAGSSSSQGELEPDTPIQRS